MLRNLLIFLFLAIMCISAQSQGIFSKITFKNAVKHADTSQKFVFVFGMTSWCDRCNKMQDETLADTAIIEFLNANYISLEVDLESDIGIDFSIKYRASPAPQYLFFDSNGYLVKRGEGYYNASDFLALIRAASNSPPELAPLPYPLDFSLDYPSWYRDYRRGPRQRSFPERADIESFLDSRDSITDEVTWAILYSLPTPEKYAGQIAANKDILARRYGKNEVLEKLSSFVFDDVKQAIKSKDESLLNAAMHKADRLLGSDADLYKFRYLLYYYQYHHNWLAYAEIGGELSQNKSLSTAAWLNEIASSIYINTNDYHAVKPALEWMYPLVEEEENYNYLHTTARLEYALGHTTQALDLAKRAVAAANANTDTSAANELIELIE